MMSPNQPEPVTRVLSSLARVAGVLGALGLMGAGCAPRLPGLMPPRPLLNAVPIVVVRQVTKSGVKDDGGWFASQGHDKRLIDDLYTALDQVGFTTEDDIKAEHDAELRVSVERLEVGAAPPCSIAMDKGGCVAAEVTGVLKRGEALVDTCKLVYAMGDGVAAGPTFERRFAVDLTNCLAQSERVQAFTALTLGEKLGRRSGLSVPPPAFLALKPPADGFEPKVGGRRSDAYALVVGIERYRDAPVAAGARADAERFALVAKKTLGVPDANLKLSIGPTKNTLEQGLVWLENSVPEGGRVYFFFSGLGANAGPAAAPFLFPHDGDTKYVESTGLALSSVLERLSATKAKEAVAFIDASFVDAGDRKPRPPAAPLARMKPPALPGRVALLSASSGIEIAGTTREGDRGLFSKLLADGLATGQADADGDRKITLWELSEWVRPRVLAEARKDGREQTPSLVVGTGADQGLVLAVGIDGR